MPVHDPVSLLAGRDRARSHSPARINARVDGALTETIAWAVTASPRELSARLDVLDHEWDLERVLDAGAGGTVVVSALLGSMDPRWLALTALAGASLMQRAVFGWTPAMALLRRYGLRTRKEIDAERTALRALRGDFNFLEERHPDERLSEVAIPGAAWQEGHYVPNAGP